MKDGQLHISWEVQPLTCIFDSEAIIHDAVNVGEEAQEDAASWEIPLSGQGRI
jgi:hypothetical protein